jgi:hypothetical protein
VDLVDAELARPDPADDDPAARGTQVDRGDGAGGHVADPQTAAARTAAGSTIGTVR